MELRQLRYFVALAEAQNFHRAAARLNMSQPPLTVAIRRLEDELGAKLFDRNSRGVTLTAAGAAALDLARQSLSSAERFRDAVKEGRAGDRGLLRVGYVGSATFEILPRLIPEFRRRYPNVDLELRESTSVDIARRLERGAMDVGLIRLPLLDAAQVETRTIDRDEMHVAVRRDSRFVRGDVIELASLANESFVVQGRISVLHAVTLMACHEAGFVPQIAQEAEQLSAVLSFVRSGLGIALVPSRAASAVPRDVKLLRLAVPVRIETGVAIARHNAPPAAVNFVALSDT